MEIPEFQLGDTIVFGLYIAVIESFCNPAHYCGLAKLVDDGRSLHFNTGASKLVSAAEIPGPAIEILLEGST